MMSRPVLRLVMGVQRSGTTALFDSLARDVRVRAVNESANNEAFLDWRLRAGPVVTDLARATGRPLLLKAISETRFRTVSEVFDELAACDVRALWIYRDPVAVFGSMSVLGWVPADERHACGVADFWVESNARLLSSLGRCAERLAVLRYEDVARDPDLFARAAAFLGIDGSSSFRSDASRARATIQPELSQMIDARTRDTLARLDAERTWHV